jgi:hypothetical protein
MLSNQWWDARELLDAAHAIRVVTPADEFFCDSAFKPVREAINAAEFAARRPWNRNWQVRPVPEAERFPDVQLRCGDDVRSFEIVEADRATRRRCSEYRAARGQPPRWTHFDPGEEASWALDEIARVIKLKAAKNYSTRPHILVYVNLWSVPEHEPKAFYADGLAHLYSDKFESAWLLWQEHTYRIWPKPAKIKLLACSH